MKSIEEMMRKFELMAAEAERREAQFVPLVDDPAVQDGPCPDCGLPAPLDREKSLEESSSRMGLRLVYDACNACQAEKRTRRELARAGVPSRVHGAKFENYEIYDERQKEAVRQIRAWIKDPEKAFLLLLGSCGAGKGHLAAAACRAFLGSSIKWRTHDEFIGKCHALDFSDREDYLDSLSGAGLLILDEMGGRSATADTPERFYRVLDKRYDRKKKTILIGNIPLRSEKGTSILSLTGDDRMESRIVETGVVIGCRWGDYRKRSRTDEAQKDAA